MLEQTIEELRHDDAAVRFEAARRLGDSKDMRAVEPLVAALPDENSKVQYACLSGLVKIGHASAAAPIVDLLLETPDSRLWGLLKLNVGMRLRHGLLDMIEAGDTTLADRLARALDGGRLDEQQEAFVLQMIGRTADTRHTAMLIERLSSEPLVTRSAAVEALGWLGDTRAFDALLALLGDEEDTLREVSTEALGRIGGERAFEPLVGALSDRDEWVRRAAADGLGRLGDRRAMSHLVAALEDENTLVQDAAFEAIKRLSDTPYDVRL